MQADGSLIVKNFPYKNYSSILIVLTNQEATVSSLYALPSQILKTKDLRLQSALKKDKDYGIKRRAAALLKENKVTIPQEAENIVLDNIS